MEDKIKFKIARKRSIEVKLARQRSIEYQKLCQLAIRPLAEACKRCTRMKYLVKDGILSPICHETCDIYKETQKTLDLIKKTV